MVKAAIETTTISFVTTNSADLVRQTFMGLVDSKMSSFEVSFGYMTAFTLRRISMGFNSIRSYYPFDSSS